MIVPTYQEEARLGFCLELLGACGGDLEVLVADGGSTDHTRGVAARYPEVRWIEAPRGRARQMNAGAAAARGDRLWFLHADCQAPPDAPARILEALGDPRTSMGAFRFAVDSPRHAYRVLELGIRVRSELLGVPYGDQGLFLRRADFERLGGFPEVSAMEDLYLVREMRRQGRVRTLPVPLVTSARRWESQGLLATGLHNWWLVVSDWLGLRGCPPGWPAATGRRAPAS